MLTREQSFANATHGSNGPISASGWKQLGGEVGSVHVGNDRAPDLGHREVAVFTDDSYRYVAGDAGWVYVGQSPRELCSQQPMVALRLHAGRSASA